MIIKEYTTNISCIIPIIDIEIGNQICRNNVWYYGESDIITFGRIYQNKIIILQREKGDDIEEFKNKIKELFSNLPQTTPFSFNQKMEYFGVNGFLNSGSKYQFGEIMCIRGKGWNKDRFFEEVKKLIEVKDEMNDKLNGDSGLVMQRYQEGKYDDIISHNHSCLIKEAYILMNSPLIWEKTKHLVDENGWIKK